MIVLSVVLMLLHCIAPAGELILQQLSSGGWTGEPDTTIINVWVDLGSTDCALNSRLDSRLTQMDSLTLYRVRLASWRLAYM